MKLTPFAKFFITVVVLVVIGYVFWNYQGGTVREWAVGKKTEKSAASGVTSQDFDALRNAPPDPSRTAGSSGVSATSMRES